MSVYAGGHSLFDPEVRLNRLTDVLSYLPRGLAHTLFAPFPWQWFDTQGSTGLFKSAAAVEVISMYLLFPVALWSMVWLIRRLPQATLRSWVVGRYYLVGGKKKFFRPVIDLADKGRRLLSFMVVDPYVPFERLVLVGTG